MLGLANRAGKVKKGAELCESAIKSGKARLLIIACDCSENTMDKFVHMAKYYGVEYIVKESKNTLGKFTGGGEKATVVILDEGFKTEIKKLFNID